MHSKMAKTLKSFGLDIKTFMLENEPKTLQDALSVPEAPYWKESINTKMDSIMQTNLELSGSSIRYQTFEMQMDSQKKIQS